MFNKKIKSRIHELSKRVDHLYDLYERLGQKVKTSKDVANLNVRGTAEIFSSLFKHLGLKLNENDEVEVVKIKKSKNVKTKTVSTPRKTTKRKSK